MKWRNGGGDNTPYSVAENNSALYFSGEKEPRIRPAIIGPRMVIQVRQTMYLYQVKTAEGKLYSMRIAH